MSSTSIRALVLCGPLLVAACGGGVVATSTEGGGGDGAAGGQGGATASSAGGSAGATASSAGGSAGAGGETTTGTFTATGGGVGDCPLLGALTLSDPAATDDGGDGTWSPGEAATVTVTMTNPGDTDVQYPGITWSSSDPLVSAPNPYNAFFVIGAGTSMPIDVGFVADAAIAKGTKVELVGKLTDIQANVCEELPAVVLDVTIE